MLRKHLGWCILGPLAVRVLLVPLAIGANSNSMASGQTVKLTVLRANGEQASLGVKLGVQPGNAVRNASTG